MHITKQVVGKDKDEQSTQLPILRMAEYKAQVISVGK
jgi:hypothetical protein